MHTRSVAFSSCPFQKSSSSPSSSIFRAIPQFIDHSEILPGNLHRRHGKQNSTGYLQPKPATPSNFSTSNKFIWQFHLEATVKLTGIGSIVGLDRFRGLAEGPRNFTLKGWSPFEGILGNPWGICHCRGRTILPGCQNPLAKCQNFANTFYSHVLSL